jgi:hypothetical protein
MARRWGIPHLHTLRAAAVVVARRRRGMTKEIRYAWFRCPDHGLPEGWVHGSVKVVPGMGQWVLVHLSPPVAELPPYLIATDDVGRALDALRDGAQRP